ncbi:M55 family metallopeptidase [soil metagenome]
MKVYVSVDMEGCAGIVHREQTDPKGFDYELGRSAMVLEANAAVQGAFDAGATEVVVSDSHGGNGMRNMRLADLDPRAQLITGSPRPLGQIDGLDDSFGALLLVGYHTRHGRAGVLSHTTNGQAVANLTVDGRIVGEIGLNARVAASLGVPTMLVTGDDLTTAEAAHDCPDAELVIVKWALGRYAARCLHPTLACAAIRRGAAAGVARASGVTPEAPVAPGAPVEIRLQFKETGSAESAARQLGATLVDDDTVAFEAASMVEAYAAYSLAVESWQPAWGAWIKG